MSGRRDTIYMESCIIGAIIYESMLFTALSGQPRTVTQDASTPITKAGQSY